MNARSLCTFLVWTEKISCFFSLFYYVTAFFVQADLKHLGCEVPCSHQLPQFLFSFTSKHESANRTQSYPIPPLHNLIPIVFLPPCLFVTWWTFSFYKSMLLNFFIACELLLINGLLIPGHPTLRNRSEEQKLAGNAQC